MNIQSLKDGIVRNKVIVSNFGYLSAVQVFSLVFPFVTYPYLIRVLGPVVFGKVIFAQSIAFYFTIVVRFGFDISATKDISVNRNNKLKISQIISSVLTIKAILWVISFIIFSIIVVVFPRLRDEKLLYILSFTICFNELLTQQYFFLGMEKMKFITYINLFSRLFFLILIFIFVHNPDDYLRVPLLNGLGALIGGIFSLGIVIIGFNTQIKFQSIKRILYYFKQSLPLFTSQVVITVKDHTSTILVGIFLGMDKVAIFDLGLKFMNILFMPISVLSNVVYPKIAKEKDMGVMMKFANFSFLVVLSSVIFVQIFVPFFVKLLGGASMLGAVFVVRILLFAPLILSYSSFLGTNCLCVLGEYKAYMKGMIYTTSFYFFLIGASYVLGIAYRVETYAFITVLVYAFELLYRYLVVRRLKIFHK